MLALLNDQPILVLMATVALGAAVGTIPLGKIRPVSYTHLTLPTNREV